MQRTWFRVALVIAGVLLIAFSWRARRASLDRVTLKVRNASVDSVVRVLRAQTWETIIARPGTTGRITLEVQNMPLTQVLELIADQAEARCTSVHAVHESRATGRALEDAIAAGAKGTSGWSNLNQRLRSSPAALFARNAASTEGYVSFHSVDQPPAEVARSLSRLGQGTVFLEDRARGSVSLNISNAPFVDAVAALARELGWTHRHLYVLEAHFRPRLPNVPPHLRLPNQDSLSDASGGDRVFNLPVSDGPIRIPLGDVPPADLAGGPPPGPAPTSDEVGERVQNQMVDSLRNSTPEQRAERLRRVHRNP